MTHKRLATPIVSTTGPRLRGRAKAMSFEQLDLLVAQSWTNGRTSFYELTGIEETEPVESDGASIGAELTSDEINRRLDTSPIELGENLRALLANHGARETIEHDLKNEIMRWFWIGYYQGQGGNQLAGGLP